MSDAVFHLISLLAAAFVCGWAAHSLVDDIIEEIRIRRMERKHK